MRTQIFPLLAFLLAFAPFSRADIDITNLYLQNAGFDDENHFDYKKNDNGNVDQEILPIYGWMKDIGVDYTVTGIYEFGTSKTFNTNGKVPAAGYNNSKGGCLALSTGWEESLKYYQNITLPAGKYKIESAFYNGSNVENGSSLLGWVANDGDASLSATSSFGLNKWTLDEVSFSLSAETEGRIQIGFKGAANGSANSAKVVVDYVKLVMIGDDKTLTGNIRTTLNTTLSDAKKLYGKGDGKNADELKTVIDQIQTTAEDASASYADLFKANENLKKKIELYEWANATIDQPLDFTKYITNPDFEDGFNGWKQSGLKTQTNTSFAQKSGKTYIEQWVSAANTVGNIQLSQTLGSELPQGIYTIKVGAQNLLDDQDNQKGAWVVAENDSVEVSKAKDYALQFTHIENAMTLEFVTYNATGNWVALDNFRLYYAAASTEDYMKEMSRRIESANDLLKNRMNENLRSNLEKAVTQSKEWLSTTDESKMPEIASALRNSTMAAQSSSNAFARLENAIQEAQAELKKGSNSHDVLSSAIQKAQTDMENESLSVADINASVQRLQNYILFHQTENTDGIVESSARIESYLTGSTMIFARGIFYTSYNAQTKEKGFCWSTEKMPTILDNRSSLSYDNNDEIFVLEGLQPATCYYIRPYNLTVRNKLAYGEPIKVYTLPKGNVTWSYNNGGSDEENERINSAVAEAVDIWNNITSIQGLHISVSYGASTPTADCSYGGSMRVGPNASYQRTGTIQHEMCHAAGVGTTDRWYNDGIYRENVSKGIWLGNRTDRVLEFLENNWDAHLKGDNTHFWPYGVNGAHEDTGSKMLYYANALIIQALGEDFLPPVSGAFASPAYTFEFDEDQNYYIMHEDYTQINLLQTKHDGSLEIVQTDWENVIKEPRLAWKVSFNPKTQLYEFKNVQNDQALSINGKEVNASAKENCNLQLLPARNSVNNFDVGFGKSFWMTFADGTNHPLAMSKGYNNSIVAEPFDHQDNAVLQRWYFLSENSIKELIGDTSGLTEEQTSSSTKVSNGNESITIETGNKAEWIYIHDLQGRLIKRFFMQGDLRISVPMEPGFYLVNGKKAVSLK